MSRLEDLKKRKDNMLDRLNARIAEAQRHETHRQRKEDTRHKIIVGACLLLDMETSPELRRQIEASLLRTATLRDAEFLRTRGWRV
jgi:hypothetical protein